VGEDTDGHTLYVDFDGIKKHDGYVYYWYLRDYLKPDTYGNWSSRIYHQGDCKLFRLKNVIGTFHKESMGVGTGDSHNPSYPEWFYPPPNSSSETILKSVCNR
jgi:hypothetical protein